MKNGQCPKCGSTEVRVKHRGLEPNGGGLLISFSNLGNLPFYTNSSEIDFYICAACGYIEQYIGNANVLAQVAAKWDRVK